MKSPRRKPRYRAVGDEMPDRLLNPPCRRKRVFLLFHWAPSSRRRSILRHGLRIGRKVACHRGGDPVDYLCFADWPLFAWHYSASTTNMAQEWDLWVVRSDRAGRITYRGDMKGSSPAELRTWQDIPAGHVTYVGSRWRRPRRRS